MKHLFLTGRKQVGKSTLLNKLIDECGLDITGYRTCPVIINGTKHGYCMHGLCETELWDNDFIVCVRLGEQRMASVTEAFDGNGVRLLQTCAASGKRWFLMDELGKAERKSPAFCDEITRILDSDVHVIGILQDCRSELVDAIKAREDVQVVTVTEENRDTLLAELTGWVARQH